MKLSVILVAYDMPREIPRTLQSLAPGYQQGIGDLEYEVIVVDNGSTRPLDSAIADNPPPWCRYHYLEDAPPSPALALNFGVEHSSGDILALMIDGAHLLTPGVFRYALAAFRTFDHPVVLTGRFFLGPGDQNDTILDGYDQAAEDGLMARIDWPHNGYRLFEIGTPMLGHIPTMNWFNKLLESNCLFLHRSVFNDIGGADERFDFPGGGFLNLDLYREAADHPATEVVQLVGEGSFHQLHGGTTTNVSAEERDRRVLGYHDQYRAIRGRDLDVTDKEIQYLGHLPTLHSKIHLRNRGRPVKPVPQELIDKFLAEQ